KPPFFDPMTDPMLLTVNNTKDAQKGDGEVRSGGRGYEHKLKCAGILKQDYAKYESVNSVMIDMAFAKQLVADSNRLNGVKDKKDITFNGLKIWADDLDKIAGIQKAVEELGFNASSMDSIRQELQGQVVKQQMLLGGLAAISLFVAAIGITNTMIMSIYERTREIGVMKVLGCFIGNIRQIFLLESGCIGFLGGVVGSIISFIISIILNTVGGNAMGMGNMYMGEEQVKVAISIIPPWLVILAIAFSTVIGLISGFSPANRAVKISALEAIKND
ncbi:MAG: FtsX-like permease family protein, partial [Oscillospiraceae bacterium]